MKTEAYATKRLGIFRDPANSIKTLRRFYKDRSKWPEFEKLQSELTGESDRAAIIITSALLDDALSITIAKGFCFEPDQVELDQCFRMDGPLGSFSSKIEIGCLFGVIDDRTAQQLTITREMRNACAHSKHPLTFSDDALINVAVRLGNP
jgi:DNA-binding MltR family transcriptional regulator